MYSTKPTIFYHKRSAGNSIDGYEYATASAQYNRHTFPYNTPFYATNKIRGRNPFYNSYSDFAADIKYVGRDYSSIAEYKVSDHIDYYIDNYFKLKRSSNLYSVIEEGEKKKIVRNLGLVTNGGQLGELILKHRFKLNFLSIDGAAPITSSNTVNLADSSFTNPKYKFDNLTLSSSLEDLTGNPTISWDQDPTATTFNEKYTHTDNVVEFANLVDAPMSNGRNTIPDKIRFDVHAIKRLLPYKNLYPVTKTVDIANKFKNYFNPNSTNVYSTKLESATDADNFSAGNLFSTQQRGLQAILEPFFAPGILYNSIKSGIAVDYPIYKERPAYYAPVAFFSGTFGGFNAASDPLGDYSHSNIIDADTEGGNTRLSGTISASFNYGGGYMLGASRCIPTILNRAPDDRMPFEALYNLSYLDSLVTEDLHLVSDFVDLDRMEPSTAAETSAVIGNQHHIGHPGVGFNHTAPVFSLRSDQAPSKNINSKSLHKYEFSINNFLCETMNFFLKDQLSLPGVKLPVAVSGLKTPNLNDIDIEKEYYMDVTLEMGTDHVSCEGPRNAGVGGGSQPDVRGENIYANTGLSASMRGYIYGPPIESVRQSGSQTGFSPDGSTVNAVQTYDEETGFFAEPVIASPFYLNSNRTLASLQADYESYFAANLQDPAYCAYTPPYFYGKSSMIVSWNPDNILPIHSGTYGYFTNIWGNINKSSFYFDSFNTGSGNPMTSSSNALCKYVPGTGSILMQRNAKMKIDSSVDVFKTAQVKIQRQFFEYAVGTDPITGETGGASQTTSGTEYAAYVCPKWVCPVLDFSSSFATTTTRGKSSLTGQEFSILSVVTNSFHDNSTGKGLWGGYGTDPYDSLAINNVLAQEGKSEADKGVRLRLDFPFKGELHKQQDTTFETGFQSSVGSKTGFYTSRTSTGAANPHLTASLGDWFGFTRDQDPIEFKIGEVADEKNISEAVVIIPYLEDPINLVGSPEDLPSGELFSTRELIPGRHFLPIHKDLFNNILSISLVERELTHEGSTNVSQDAQAGGYAGFESEPDYSMARNTDIYKLTDLILGNEYEGRNGYELPPELDFVHYKDVSPFQMIIIPVDHTLDKQELIDIYQGVMPDSSLKFEKSIHSKEISMQSALLPIAAGPGGAVFKSPSWMPKLNVAGLSEGESAGYAGSSDGIVGDLSVLRPQNFLDPSFIYAMKRENISSLVSAEDSNFNIPTDAKDFYSKVKFMTFKIKQKSIKDYAAYKNLQIQRTIKNKILATEKKSEYVGSQIVSLESSKPSNKKLSQAFGYNWPYDDFSLIESVKIDVTFEVSE